MSNENDDLWQTAARHRIIPRGDDDFPQLLDQIPNPPHLLYVDGDAEILHLPALAIVGSRNPSKGGERNAYEFARHLASVGRVRPVGGSSFKPFPGSIEPLFPTVGFRKSEVLSR